MIREEMKNVVIDHLAGKMTCKEFVEAVTDYLEGKLPFFRWLRFQMHLGWCPGCRAYLRQMRQAVRTLGQLPQEPPPPQVREELLERFRTWKNKQTD